jgi:hypothetical protein
MSKNVHERIPGMIDIQNTNEKSASLFSTESSKLYEHNYSSISSRKEQTQLSKHFFSPSNIDLLQNQIRHLIYKKTDKIISNQSTIELKLLMTSVYENNGKNLHDNISEQVEDLNNIVITKSVAIIETNLRQYLSYIIDKSTIPMPISRPKYSNPEISKSLRYNTPF